MKPYQRKPRLTVTELRSIVAYYHDHFPSWKIIDKGTLVREDGPVAQGITFERLSGGAYRPTGHIRVLVAPEESWGFELPQFPVKPRAINRRQDREFRPQVVEAIRAQFVPSVDRPLVAEEVLNLYESEAVPTSAQAYSLAALNAYLGRDERALDWCSLFTELVKGEWQDFHHEQRAFLKKLEDWIRTGEAKPQLELVLQQERRKWGLA